MNIQNLRLMEEADLSLVRSWRNQDEVRQNMYTSHKISEEEHLNWWQKNCKNPQTRLLIFELNNEPKGVVIFTNYTGENGTADWAFYSGNLKSKGIGSYMEKLALEYAFNQLNLRKLNCEVLSLNMPVVSFHRKFGFKIEGKFKEAYQRDGIFYDIYCLALFKKQWLKTQSSEYQTKYPKTYQKSFIFSAELIDLFAQISTDKNPIHLDKQSAINAGFKDRIAHGTLGLSFISSILGCDFPSKGSIYLSQQVSFLKPIYINSKANISLKILSKVGRVMELETNILVNDELCVTGEAQILLPK